MAPTTLFAALRLASASDRSSLEKDKAHQAALQKLSQQGGYSGRITWDVLEEDKTILVWLVEYDGQPQGALDSLSPLPFLADLKPILSSSKPIINASFFELAPQPSGLYSSTYPTWEVWQFRLKPGKTIEDHYAAFKPNSSFFTKTGRPFTANISTSSSDGQQSVLYIIGWKSTKEHMDARKSPGAAAGFKKIQANIQEIVTFGHIQTESSKAEL